MAQKPRIPKGTRDFSPQEVAKRNYIFDVIKRNFECFGFQPIETPSFELSDTLMGKYGEEGDRLIFKILNSGDYNEKLKKAIVDFCNLGTMFYQKYIIDEKKYSWESEKSRDEVIDSFSKAIKNGNNSSKEFLNENIVLDLFKCIHQSYKDSDTNDEIASKVFINFFYNLKSNYITKNISEKALRYDLTVPFARYVVQHQNEIEFPFKRYQIQPVWRADRPQKGRFREFYQCDADVVGSTSLVQEVEFVQLYDTVFTDLGLKKTTIKINNRKILSGIASVIGAQDKLIDFTVALDKLDKIGEEKVKEEMLAKGIPQSGIDKLSPLFSISGSFTDRITSLKDILSTSEEGLQGIKDIEFVYNTVASLGLKSAHLELDVTLARGLNYYTGAIFEVAPPEGVKMGSIGGGGRYDDLTSIFGLPNVSGVGISFGLDRIYLVLEELDLFPETVSNTVQTVFINFGEAEALYCLKAIKALRAAGLSAELYPDATKMKKQMNYANRREIPYVILVGSDEIANNTYTLKNMTSGEQSKLSLEQLIKALK